MVPAVLGLLGTLTADTLNSEFGWPTGMWWVWYLVGAVIVYLLNIFGIGSGPGPARSWACWSSPCSPSCRSG